MIRGDIRLYHMFKKFIRKMIALQTESGAKSPQAAI